MRRRDPFNLLVLCTVLLLSPLIVRRETGLTGQRSALSSRELSSRVAEVPAVAGRLSPQQPARVATSALPSTVRPHLPQPFVVAAATGRARAESGFSPRSSSNYPTGPPPAG